MLKEFWVVKKILVKLLDKESVLFLQPFVHELLL